MTEALLAKGNDFAVVGNSMSTTVGVEASDNNEEGTVDGVVVVDGKFDDSLLSDVVDPYIIVDDSFVKVLHVVAGMLPTSAGKSVEAKSITIRFIGNKGYIYALYNDKAYVRAVFNVVKSEGLDSIPDSFFLTFEGLKLYKVLALLAKGNKCLVIRNSSLSVLFNKGNVSLDLLTVDLSLESKRRFVTFNLERHCRYKIPGNVLRESFSFITDSIRAIASIPSEIPIDKGFISSQKQNRKMYYDISAFMKDSSFALFPLDVMKLYELFDDTMMVSICFTSEEVLFYSDEVYYICQYLSKPSFVISPQDNVKGNPTLSFEFNPKELYFDLNILISLLDTNVVKVNTQGGIGKMFFSVLTRKETKSVLSVDIVNIVGSSDVSFSVDAKFFNAVVKILNSDRVSVTVYTLSDFGYTLCLKDMLSKKIIYFFLYTKE